MSRDPGASRDPRELAGAWQRFQTHRFPQPSADLSGIVARYWSVTWDYETPYRQLIVPYPNVHLTFRGDQGAAVVTGVASRHVTRVWMVRAGWSASRSDPVASARISTMRCRS